MADQSMFEVFTPLKSFKQMKKASKQYEPVLRLKRPSRKRKRHTCGTPADILKDKLKQSVSMHDLSSEVRSVMSRDNYHTVHASSDLGASVRVVRGRFGARSERKKEVVYKCCCGTTRCKTVVPIQQYLETYFDKRVSDNELSTVVSVGDEKLMQELRSAFLGLIG